MGYCPALCCLLYILTFHPRLFTIHPPSYPGLPPQPFSAPQIHPLPNYPELQTLPDPPNIPQYEQLIGLILLTPHTCSGCIRFRTHYFSILHLASIIFPSLWKSSGTTLGTHCTVFVVF